MKKKKKEKKEKSIRDRVEVCPICFSIVKRSPQIFDVNSTFHCTNSDCGWSGSFAVEVDIDDYKQFLVDKQKNNGANKNSRDEP
ncbi:MAG: hypothetical protein ACTSVB_03080 [Candidatus Heimdallarchaeaceae archaeon]|uniref:Uncharacterized protein n=1 Tax=Candidatus Heimdallarchaeum endolithica TaxID=2876572 RepID=A0A9Y1BR47_9ARCH|nr:MAG: hypothetical protein K9W46_14275 [Candidatus Heimdallarchaeum endolithica]